MAVLELGAADGLLSDGYDADDPPKAHRPMPAPVRTGGPSLLPQEHPERLVDTLARIAFAGEV